MTKVVHPYWLPLVALFRSHGDQGIAAGQKAYMKDRFPFHGLKMPVRRSLVSTFLSDYGPPPAEALEAIVRNGWAQPEREMHYTAMELLAGSAKRSGPEVLPLAEELILSNSWWDTVDFLAVHVVGVVLRRHPEMISTWNAHWMDSEDRWAQRTALLFQLKWKADTDRRLLFANCKRLSDHKDFFIRKGIGWALREFAKTDARAVVEFVGSQQFSPLTVREALKHR